jgi:hypothetical protein
MRASVSFVTLFCFASVASGCLSHEYAIPKSELGRLAATPPELRGAQVRVVQQMGTRRGEPIPVDEPLAPGPAAEVQGGYADTQVWIDGRLVGTYGGPGPRAYGGPAAGGWRGTAHGTGPGWNGSPASAGGWKGSASGGGGGGGLHMPSGGGSDGDALVVVAVVAVVIAAVAAVGLVGTEGLRYDGRVAMSPYQPVHLKDGGGEHVVALGDLTPAAIAGVDEALVMDDEGFGFQRLGQKLRRRGLTFKLDAGTLAFAGSEDGGAVATTVVGPAAHVQLGGFLTDTFGALLTAELGGATDRSGATLTRHSLGLELQSFWLNLGAFHLGTYTNGGLAISGKTGSDEVRTGPRLGGGLLAEVDLTGRMALVLRGGGSLASLGGWSSDATGSIGLAIY